MALRVRLHLSRRSPAVGEPDAGAVAAPSSRRTSSRRWCRSARSTPRSGRRTGRWSWTTTWSPITCRSGTPGSSRMFTPDYEDQRGRSARSARHELAARAAVVEVVGADVPAARRQGHRAPARAQPSLLALLQHAAEPRARRVSGPDGFLPGAAARARSSHHPRRDVRPAGCTARDADRPIPERPDQPAGESRRPMAVASACRKDWPRAATQPGPLSTFEVWMLEFHEMLRSCIPESRLDTAPEHFA